MTRCPTRRWTAGLLGLLGGVAAALAAAAPATAIAPTAAGTTAPGPGAGGPSAAAAIEQIIAEGGATDLPTSSSVDREQLAAVYQLTAGHLLWSDGSRPTAAATQLLAQLSSADQRGLDPLDYSGADLSTLAQSLARPPAAGVARWALFDTALSLMGLHFLADVHFGRIEPATVGHNLTLERARLDLPRALTTLAAAPAVGAAVDALEPQFTHFQLLKRALATYRTLAARPDLVALPGFAGKSLKPGAAYAGAPQLERLLTALGDLPAPAAGTPPGELPGAPPATLTPELVAGLKRFQSRHGEQPDGVLGSTTFAELTRPLNTRVRQIELTLERWRWLPTSLASAPIIVNIPQFRLFAFESTRDAEAHIRQMDVIVGKAFEATQTPVFAADMKYLVFRPYWEVPYSIAVKEIVPEARRDPASLGRKQLEIVRGGGDDAVVQPDTPANLEAVARGELRIRQKPGPSNSLGLVKFMFPNPYNVYLHSTPAQSLFAEPRRDFSHGCVRVSDPVGLAEYVLRDAPEWTREKILAAMNGTAPQTVTLRRPLRVFIVYGTALALEDGRVEFFDDIYGHDRRLEAALAARRPRSATPRAPGRTEP